LSALIARYRWQIIVYFTSPFQLYPFQECRDALW
jgi:hypothetical protein